MHTQGVVSLCGRVGVCVCGVCVCGECVWVWSVGGCSIEMSVYILLSYLLRVCWQNFKCAVMKLLATNAVNTRSHTHTHTYTHTYAHTRTDSQRQSRHHFMAWFRQSGSWGILLILQTPAKPKSCSTQVLRPKQQETVLSCHNLLHTHTHTHACN